ncbi:sulfite exporter TauE/SafE family protein [Nocardioides jensenii]|uniref:sulfite exporter TauE/SafE family protein n=1 Tax=Nocardioides jensenii TaxID=1843 RepID=UPI000835F8EE|nr:sulfite exporter TauE/SafE family protein [Nocardioides jensenii]
MIAVLGLLGLVIGALVGMVGVGGVLLPPGLVMLGDLSVHEATATSTWVFIFTGVVGTITYASRRAIPWDMLWPLALGVVPAALAGALLSSVLPGALLLVGLAVLTLAVGFHQLLPGTRHLDVGELGAASLLLIGAGVGLGSSLTGTGGPVILVPVLLLLGVEPLKAIAVSQAIQLPVVLTGSIGFLQAGLVDVRLGTLLGLIAGLGAVAGAILATRFHADGLRKVVAWACLAAGVLTLVRLVG